MSEPYDLIVESAKGWHTAKLAVLKPGEEMADSHLAESRNRSKGGIYPRRLTEDRKSTWHTATLP